MVKKISQFGLVAALVLAGALGCNKNASPVVPANSAVLHLTLPSKIPNSLSKTVSSQSTIPVSGQGALEYFLSAEGQAPVTGVILFNDGSQVGNIFINLPKAGVWLVAAEWFAVSSISAGVKSPKAQLVLPGYNTSPEFAGADEVNVQGTTSFTLNMEQISNQTEGICYNGDMTDSTNLCDFNLGGVSWQDLYSFNTGVEFASNTTVASVADIQALYDPVTTLSTYFGSLTGASFAYLGNGDLVNFPVVPGGATFYPNTVAAKAAVVGSAAASITANDIFVVKGPEPNQMVWFQIWIDNPNCSLSPNSSLIQFWYVYNNEGLNYMKFDETANGHLNCNQNTVPTFTPTPTATP